MAVVSKRPQHSFARVPVSGGAPRPLCVECRIFPADEAITLRGRSGATCRQPVCLDCCQAVLAADRAAGLVVLGVGDWS